MLRKIITVGFKLYRYRIKSSSYIVIHDTHFNLTTVRTVPSVLIFLTKLKSPTKMEPSGAAAKATGANNLWRLADPAHSDPHSRARCLPSPIVVMIRRGLCFR